MTIRDLQYKIQEAIDEFGVPDTAEVRVVKDVKGGVLIRAEYGCGHFVIAEDVNGDAG